MKAVCGIYSFNTCIEQFLKGGKLSALRSCCYPVLCTEIELHTLVYLRKFTLYLGNSKYIAKVKQIWKRKGNKLGPNSKGSVESVLYQVTYPMLTALVWATIIPFLCHGQLRNSWQALLFWSLVSSSLKWSERLNTLRLLEYQHIQVLWL